MRRTDVRAIKSLRAISALDRPALKSLRTSTFCERPCAGGQGGSLDYALARDPPPAITFRAFGTRSPGSSRAIGGRRL